jgi:hypothetical protein
VLYWLNKLFSGRFDRRCGRMITLLWKVKERKRSWLTSRHYFDLPEYLASPLSCDVTQPEIYTFQLILFVLDFKLSPCSECYMLSFGYFHGVWILHSYPPMKMGQSVPKRWHIKFRRRGITQKKTYNKMISFGCYVINTWEWSVMYQWQDRLDDPSLIPDWHDGIFLCTVIFIVFLVTH